MSVRSDELRRSFKENDDIRDRGLTTPENIERYDNICYGGDNKWQILDVYRPKGIDEKLPVIISVHGGGWVYGDKERYQYYCMDLAKRGFAVINFTYRLAPEYKFPAQIEDTGLVFNWLQKNADKYSLDMGNVFAVGDSAGAHTLTMFVNMVADEKYRNKVLSEYSMEYFDCVHIAKGGTNSVWGMVNLKAVGLNCGKYLMDEKEELILDYKPNYKLELFYNLMNLPQHIVSAFPASFIMTCSDDFLREEPKYMIEQFDVCEVPYEYHFYGDEKNKLPHVFHCDIKSKYAKICNDEQCEFFRSFI